MKLPLLFWFALLLGFGVSAYAADENPEIVDLGHDTYSLTVWAKTGFARDKDKLKEAALEDAAAYCAKLHKELKVISTEAKRPVVPLTGFAHAKVVFKALDANDPELHATATTWVPPGAAPASAAAPVEGAPRSSTDALYSDLVKLDDLRKRGILSEEEFQAQKKKLLEKSN